MSQLRDFIFVAMENWDEVWRRNQPVAAGLARRSPDRRLLFVGLSIDVSNHVRKGRFGQAWAALRQRQLANPDGLPNVYLLNCVKWLPNTVGVCRAFNRWHERRQIRRACRRLRFDRPILWMNPYYSVHLPGRMHESLVVYDVGDDWTSFTQPTEWLRRQVIAEDDALTARADVTIVVSEKLYAMKKGLARRLYHIPNGVYVDRYEEVVDRTLPPHPMTLGWPGPVFGYTGTLHPDRIDIDLIVGLARAFPTGTVALVGPDMTSGAAAAKLAAEPNIRVTGSVPFDEVPEVMCAFDVCVVPHLVTSFTDSLSPLKLYEYLAAGLPTVSTPVSGFRDHPDVVYLASEPGAFIDACTRALSETLEQKRRRQAAAAPHSWDARVAEIESVLEKCLSAPGRQPDGAAPYGEPAHA